MNQRWRNRHANWAQRETIATRNYEVATIAGDTAAKNFIVAHHYSGTYPAARFRYGLYKHDALVGVAVFSVPCNPRTLALFPGDWKRHVELGRFVLLDTVPHNGETWFLGQCFRELRQEGIGGVVAFSDPMPRHDEDGRCFMPGHVGTIYQAHNGVYLGRSRAENKWVLRSGNVFHRRKMSKIRKQERGWHHCAAELVANGAPLPRGNPGDWLSEWLPRVATSRRHPGNHKYAWPVERRIRQHMPSSLPYPKAA